MSTDSPTLICSAGNDTTHSIIDAVATLMPDRPVMLLRAWRSAEYTIASATAAVVGSGTVDYAALDKTIEQEAEEDARSGAEYARSLGLTASGEVIRSDGPVWQSIVATAKAQGAAVIVTGNRGRNDLESALLGSTSHALLHHSTIPVIVVPAHDSAQ